MCPVDLRRLRVVSLVVLCVALTGCSQGAEATLAGSAQTVTSLASEGAVLARDLAGDRVTRTFAQQHAFDLLAQASEQSASLDEAPAPPGRGPQLEELRAIAHRVVSDLRALSGAPSDPASLATDLENAARSGLRIGEAMS
jgi:hypothetical protein